MRVLFAEKNTFWCTGFLGPHRQPPGVKKVIFPKFFPSLNSARIFYFLYPQTSLRLLAFIKFKKKINFIKFFKVCVWRKFCKFLKKNSNAFWKDPFGKKSQKFLFPVSLGCPETFLFWKNVDGSKRWARILCLGVGGAGQGKALVGAFPVIL